MTDYNVTRRVATKITDRFSNMLRNLEDDFEEEIVMITIDLKTFEEMADKIIDMEETIAQFFALLDVTEETDDGRVFRPNVLRSCRAADAVKLENILAELKGTITLKDKSK